MHQETSSTLFVCYLLALSSAAGTTEDSTTSLPSLAAMIPPPTDIKHTSLVSAEAPSVPPQITGGLTTLGPTASSGTSSQVPTSRSTLQPPDSTTPTNNTATPTITSTYPTTITSTIPATITSTPPTTITTVPTTITVAPTTITTTTSTTTPTTTTPTTTTPTPTPTSNTTTPTPTNTTTPAATTTPTPTTTKGNTTTPSTIKTTTITTTASQTFTTTNPEGETSTSTHGPSQTTPPVVIISTTDGTIQTTQAGPDNVTLSTQPPATEGLNLSNSERNMTIIFSVVLGVFLLGSVIYFLRRCRHRLQYSHQALYNTGDEFEADDDTLVISGGLYDGHAIFDQPPPTTEGSLHLGFINERERREGIPTF